MSTLNFTWDNGSIDSTILAKFFSEQIDATYISHSELQSARTTPKGVWSRNLYYVVLNEIAEIRVDQHRMLAVAEMSGELFGLGSLLLSRSSDRTYAVLEDFLVAKTVRGKNVGTKFLSWIENELKRDGVLDLFLESGSQNAKAHRFFERNGFRLCSVVMEKKL